MKTHGRYNAARIILIVITLFVGIGAVAGALTMFIDPTGETTGMSGLLPGLRKLPFASVLFENLIFSGVALLIVNGISNLIAAFLLFAKKPLGALLGMIFGVTLMLWIVIQFVIFEDNFLSNAFFTIGILQAITGYATMVFQKQESFKADIKDYPNIGANEKVLVVYFSRMGYVKKLALEQAEKTGGQLFEITSKERTAGTLGFLWCGRFNMHRWDMPIDDIPENLDEYDKIIICTPVWVFALAAPIRTFCKKAKGCVKNAEYVVCHFSSGKYENVSNEMDELLGVKADCVTNVICRFGKYVKITQSEAISRLSNNNKQ